MNFYIENTLAFSEFADEFGEPRPQLISSITPDLERRAWTIVQLNDIDVLVPGVSKDADTQVVLVFDQPWSSTSVSQLPFAAYPACQACTPADQSWIDLPSKRTCGSRAHIPLAFSACRTDLIQAMTRDQILQERSYQNHFAEKSCQSCSGPNSFIWTNTRIYCHDFGGEMGYCSRCDAMRNFRPGNYKPICLTCLQLKAKPCLCGSDMIMHDSALSQNQPFMFFSCPSCD